MKPWMAVVIVVVVLAAGLWLMAPGGESGGSVSAGASNEKIAIISKGDRVEIAGHLQSGRFTIVEFTADW